MVSVFIEASLSNMLYHTFIDKKISATKFHGFGSWSENINVQYGILHFNVNNSFISYEKKKFICNCSLNE